MSSLKDVILLNKKTLIVIVGVILALLITFSSQDLFSTEQGIQSVQEIADPIGQLSGSDLLDWIKKPAKQIKQLLIAY